MELDVGRFTDEEPPETKPQENEEPEIQPSWDEADEGDRRYDLMVERQLFERHNWPDNEDTALLRIVRGPEDDTEWARRRPRVDREAA